MIKANRIIPNVTLCLQSDQPYLNSDLFTVRTAEDVVDILRGEWESIEIFETFKIVLLNRANQVVGLKSVTNMAVSSVNVDISVILKLALLSNASGVILAHNHPSGRLEASIQDRNLTKLVRDALKMVDITLLDHVILTNSSFYSFADRNEI